MTISQGIFGDMEHIRLSEIAFSTLQRIFFRKHLSFFFPGFNGHHQGLFRILVLIINDVVVITFNVLLELRRGRIVVVERDANPGELYPDPSLVVVE